MLEMREALLESLSNNLSIPPVSMFDLARE